MKLRNSRLFWFSFVSISSIAAITMAVSVKPPSDAVLSSPAMQAVATTRPTRRLPSLTNPPGVIDFTAKFESREAFASGEMDWSRAIDDPTPRVVLNDTKPRDYPRTGSWTTPVIESPFNFNEIVPSWNAQTPHDTGVFFEIRVRCAADWSPWLFIGEWGRTIPSEHLERFDGGRIAQDNLQLKTPANAVQMRVTFTSFNLDPSAVPSLRRLRVIYSGVPPESQRSKWKQSKPVATGWARDLPVPYRAQGDSPPNLSYQLCSPTSTSMVLSYWGVDRPTLENALAIYDPDHEMFGNWGRAVQYAGSLGLDAWLERFRNWDQVKTKIAAGQPVIASIKFNAGEFPSSVLHSSKGHLIVIRGFTPAGDVICNDPGNRARGKDVVYKADELAHAWFDKGGVGYVIVGKTPATTQPSTQPTVAKR